LLAQKVAQNVAQKVAQKAAVSLCYFAITKITKNLQNMPNWPKITQYGHPARVFNSTFPILAKRPSLKLKTQPERVLGYLAIPLPVVGKVVQANQWSMEQHVFCIFINYRGRHSKGCAIHNGSYVNLQQKPWFHGTKMYF
jgi:hypothetical protein